MGAVVHAKCRSFGLRRIIVAPKGEAQRIGCRAQDDTFSFVDGRGCGSCEMRVLRCAQDETLYLLITLVSLRGVERA